MPGDWDPAYADRPELADWVEGRGGADSNHVCFPYPLRSMAAEIMSGGETDPSRPAFAVRTMTKRKCAGPAPYVGRPFRYEWWVGVDNLGRAIAGDARIVYASAHR
jgi:hypothetical protein